MFQQMPVEGALISRVVAVDIAIVRLAVPAVPPSPATAELITPSWTEPPLSSGSDVFGMRPMKGRE